MAQDGEIVVTARHEHVVADALETAGIVFRHLLHAGRGRFVHLVVGVNLLLKFVQTFFDLSADGHALLACLLALGGEAAGVDAAQQLFQTAVTLQFGVEIGFPLLERMLVLAELIHQILQILTGLGETEKALALLGVEHDGVLLALVHALVHLRPVVAALCLVAGDVIFQISLVGEQIVVKLLHGEVHVLLLDHGAGGQRYSKSQQ